MFLRKKKGFTLIELLVVIAIIGILATIVLVSLNTARAKARDARRSSDMHQMALAMEMYYDDHNSSYPPSLGGDPENSALLAPFMPVAPGDPGSLTNYVWDSNATGTYYCVWATLESKTPQTYVLSNPLGTKEVTVAPSVGATNCGDQ